MMLILGSFTFCIYCCVPARSFTRSFLLSPQWAVASEVIAAYALSSCQGPRLD